MPRGFTEREKDLIRKRLVKEAYKRFSAHGLKDTNIEDLAKAAKISKGAFYLFYESKESLFMDVAELAEQRYRQEVLAAIDLPGPSPRARLTAVLSTALLLLRTIPVLQFLRGSDFDLLFRRVPAEKLQEHLASDRRFFDDFVVRCRNSGIPIQARSEDISRLLYPLVLTTLHEDELDPDSYGGSLDLLTELVAAFCLGEVRTESRGTSSPAPASGDGSPT